MLETARDLTLEAAQSASAAGRRKDLLGLGSKASTVQETRKLLNSRMDREVLEGLKRVIEVHSLSYPTLATYQTLDSSTDIPPPLFDN